MMPRVVANQKEKFDNDELFRKLSRESEVRYTGYRDRTLTDRRSYFQQECKEGRASVAVIGSGVNFQLLCHSNSWCERPDDRRPTKDFVDFDKEPNKVHLKSQFILNGVCVAWTGWIDLLRLDGAGHLEFDIERAAAEDSLRLQQLENYSNRFQFLGSEGRPPTFTGTRSIAISGHSEQQHQIPISSYRMDRSASDAESTGNSSNSRTT